MHAAGLAHAPLQACPGAKSKWVLPDRRNSLTKGPAFTGWSCTVSVSKLKLREGGLKKGSRLPATAMIASTAMKAPGVWATVRARAPGFVSLYPVQDSC